MSGLRVLDLFSGIGGFSLGLERTGGFKTIAFCEIDPFCRRVLAKHWPGVPIYEDITTADFSGVSADVICGGFPCQDVSNAGKRAGITGERSGLWKHLVGAIRVVRPKYAIVENVAALLSNGLGVVLRDLAEIGYDAEWHCIPASYVGRPTGRDRVWIVANPRERAPRPWGQQCLPKSPEIDWPRLVHAPRSRRNYGLSDWLDRVGAVGNAVVPQIPELIGRAILQAEGVKT